MGQQWIFIVILGIFGGKGSQAFGGHSQSVSVTDCESMEIMKCIQSTQNDGQLFFPDTQQKLMDYCKHLMAGLDCARNLIDHCVSEADRDMYYNLTRDMVGMNVALCTPGSSLSTRFLKHVDCFKSLSDRFRTCSDRYIGNLVVVQSLSQAEQMAMTCCTVHEYNSCMRNAVKGRCEQDAERLVEETVGTALKQYLGHCRTLGDIPTSNCMKRYSPGNSHETSNFNLEDNPSGQPSLLANLMFLPILLIILLS